MKFIKQYSVLSFVFGYLFLSGCTSSKITSNKSPEFNDKLSKVFLVMRSGTGSKEFAYSFKTAFLRSLESRGIASAYHIYDPLSLESEKQVSEKIEKFNPQALIIINQTESRGYNAKNVIGGVFDIRIMLQNSDAPIWRANLDANGESGIEYAVDKAVKKLIDRLIVDKMI